MNCSDSPPAALPARFGSTRGVYARATSLSRSPARPVTATTSSRRPSPTGGSTSFTPTFLVRACIESIGRKCGLMGTVVYDTGSGAAPSSLTTPDCLTVAEAQKQMGDAGAEYMVIE